MAARVRCFIQGESKWYIHISGVREEIIELIENAFKDVGIYSAVRFTFDQHLKAQIITCKISQVHEKTSQSFHFELRGEITCRPGHSKYYVSPAHSQIFSV